jgi:hypothetical protein
MAKANSITPKEEHFCHQRNGDGSWLSGRPAFERPVNEVPSSSEPKFPRCLCWANEIWKPRWGGLDDKVRAPEHPRISCVCPSWDNSARKSGAVISANYPRILRALAARGGTPPGGSHRGTRKTPSFTSTRWLSYWNEWAEGKSSGTVPEMGRAHLEEQGER